MKQIKPYYILLLSLIAIIFLSWKTNDQLTNQFQIELQKVNSIVIDNQGVKWIATEKGVVKFDGKKWTNYADNKSLNSSVSVLAFDILLKINQLWMGSNLGLNSMEVADTTNSIINYNTTNSGILSDSITALGIDGSDVKYIGTSKGLSILKSNKWDKFYGRKSEEILSEYKINSVGTSSNGYIYATTLGGGVSRFKYADAVSGATTYNLPWAWGLPSDSVFTVFVDGIAQWYGTLRGAAYHSSEYTKADWTTYTRTEGLICDSVYAIAKDSLGNMWFGTHKGVSKLSIDSTWTSYTSKDGLVADKVNTIAIDVDGSIWFGTDNGISHYINNEWKNYQEISTFIKSHKISSVDLFSVYPNPAKNQINIKKTNAYYEGMSIEIRSISGVIMKSKEFNHQNQSIDIGDLVPGIYLLTVSSNQASQTVRIIKQ